jgi:hypothetical protein
MFQAAWHAHFLPFFAVPMPKFSYKQILWGFASRRVRATFCFCSFLKVGSAGGTRQQAAQPS